MDRGRERLRRVRGIWCPRLAVAAIALVILIAGSVSPVSAASNGSFVTTSGTQLVLNGRPWYLYGAATYGTSNPGGQQSIGAEISLATSAGLNTLRIVNMFDERGIDPNAPYDQTAWAHVDQLLAAIHAAGLHAILDLSAFRNHLQNRELYVDGNAATASGYPTPSECTGLSGDGLARCVGARWCIENAASCTDPYSAGLSSAWGTFLQFVATRTNTVTGVEYAADPTIALVSFAGEPNPPNSGEPLKPATQELTDFYARVFDQWKAHDPNHLVTSGGLLHIDWEELYGSDSGINYQAIFALPNQDVLSIHNYFGRFPATAANDAKTAKVATAAANVGKPWITEEFGFQQTPADGSTVPPTTYSETDRGAWFRNVYAIQRHPSAGVPSAGVAFWNLGPEVAATSHDVNPGTPATWAAVQENAPSEWQVPQTLSQATMRAFTPKLAADGSGRATLLWESYDPSNVGNSTLTVANHLAGGAWQTIPPIATGGAAQEEQVVTNSSGAAMATWVLGLSVWASYRSPGGSWDAVPTELGGSSNGVYFPSVALADNGEAVVTWMSSIEPSTAYVQTRFRRVDGTWAPPEQQPSGPRTIDRQPSVAYDANGEAVLVWQSLDIAGFYDVLSSSHPAGGAWTAPVRLSSATSSVGAPSLAANRNGTAVATWIDITSVEADVRSGGTWGSPTALAFMQSSLAEQPRAAVDQAGDATVVWNRYDGTVWRAEASSRPAGGSWQVVPDTLATNTPGQSEIDLSGNSAGDVVVVWLNSDGANLRVDASRKPAGGSWQATPDVLSPAGTNAGYPAVAIDSSGLVVAGWTVVGSGGNEIVQVAFSDGTPPSVDLHAPAANATFAQGQSVHADYSCVDEAGGSGIAACTGTVADGVPIDTSTPGAHSFTVTATDRAGNTTPVTYDYTVTAQATIHVAGTQIVDAAGTPLLLRGVNYSGTEYMCVQGSPTPSTHGRGIFEGPTNTPTPPSELAAWNITAVRLPLNEDCWLGINGVDPSYGGASYRQAVTGYVNALVADGIVPILELSGSAPGTTLAGFDQQPMPDHDHSIDFWRDLATTFKDDGRVVFDLFNEPFPDGNQDTVTAWTCWRDGGVACPGLTYDAVGMQELVDTVRSAGAANLILLGGVQFARINSNWLTYRPSDPDNNLAASWHLYPNTYCPDEACWDTQFQPFVAQTAAVATEIGQGGTAPCGAGFLDRAMLWLDAHDEGYLAWTWDAWGDCFSLIANWGDAAPPYAPTSPYGQTLHDHLLGIPQPPSGVVAAAGDGTASVSWIAPTDVGANGITSYTVKSSPGGLTTTAGASAAAATVTGLANGTSYTFTVTATSAGGTGAASAPSNAVTPKAGSPAPLTVSGTAGPGGTITTDPGGGPTPSVPLTTAVLVPAGGDVGIAESGITEAAPAGYSFLGEEVYIDAPAATPSIPLQLTFTLDASAVGSLAPADVAVFRTEAGSPAAVQDCGGAAGVASPDPCVSARTALPGGDLQLKVLTSTASRWDFGFQGEPQITITAVSKALLGSGDPSTKVTWHADENGSYSVRVGGSSCTTGTQVAAGAYTGAPAAHSTTVNATSLAEGSNTIRICVTDSAPRTKSAVTVVGKDTTAPVVMIDGLTPAVLGAANNSTSLSWHAGENGSYSVRVGGATCTAGTQVASGSYGTSPATVTAVVGASSLANGANTLRVCVTDAAGNTGSQTTVATKDATPPVVTIDSVSPAVLGPGGSATVTWHANENGAFTVLVGGTDCASGTQAAAGTYSSKPAKATTSIPASLLAVGPNTIRVCVTDAAGNSGSQTASVTKDTTPPIVTIDSVSPSLLGVGGTATLTWHASENGAFTVLTGGSDCASGTQLASGNYTGAPATRATTVKAGSLAEGANTIRVCVTDTAGNKGAQTTSVAKDTTAPVVTIDSVSPGLVGVGGSTSVSWHAGENGSYSVRVGGASCGAGTQVASGSYTTSPAVLAATVNTSSLASGANTIRVCVTDLAGNRGSQTTSVKKDITAPTITITRPTNNASYTVGQTVNASFACTDETGGSGIVSCVGTAANGAAIDTSSRGTKTFSVTATDQAGNTTTRTVSYRVT